MAARLFVAMCCALSVACGYLDPPNQLASAARVGDLEEINRLVKAGADVNAPSGVNGWPPLLHALHKGQHASVERLLELGASVEGQTGHDVLMWASGYAAAEWRGCGDHAQLVRKVLAHNPALKDGAVEARALADRKGCREIVELLAAPERHAGASAASIGRE